VFVACSSKAKQKVYSFILDCRSESSYSKDMGLGKRDSFSMVMDDIMTGYEGETSRHRSYSIAPDIFSTRFFWHTPSHGHFGYFWIVLVLWFGCPP
jgi:hypothetical protein